MISFKQFLAEARMAPLYHGTDLYNLEHILIDKQGILPRTDHSSEELLITRRIPHRLIKGISTSRNFKFSAQYRGEGSAVLELDQRMLGQNYKIVPIQFWQNPGNPVNRPARPKERVFAPPKRNEYEEFIITDKPIPVKYITRLYVPGPMINKDGNFLRTFRTIADIYGPSFVRTF